MPPELSPEAHELRGPFLVTGGAGFVGSHVARALLDKGPVHVLDDLSTGSIDRLPEGVTFHLGDIRSDQDVQRVLSSARIQAIIHCAAQTSVARSMADPEIDWQVNVLGTHLLARKAKAAGVKRFVYFSSGGAIYGDTDHPAIESDLPAPRSYYGLNKYAAEQIVRLEAPSYAILRPSNIYGSGQRTDLEGGVIAIFFDRLMRGEPVVIHGDGSQERDFVHVDDVVAAVEAALSNPDDVVWNVASGESTSIVSLYEKVQGALGINRPPHFAPRRAGDVDRSVLCPQRRASYPYRSISLGEGLRMLVAEMRGEHSLQAIAGS